MSDIILDWSLWDWYKITDYILSEWDTDRLPKLQKLDTKRFSYNQSKNEWSKKSCTIYSAIGSISDLFNYSFSDSEIKAIDELSYSENEYQKNWARVKGSWWYDGFAVDLVRNYWNWNKNLGWKFWKVITYSISMKDDALINAVLDKNYNICTWYYWNSKYNADRDDNLILDWTSWGTTTYWHAINLVWLNWSIYVKDNYDWRKSNIYKVKNPISKISWWHSTWFIFVKVDNTEEIKRLNEIKTLCNVIIPNLWTLYNKVNDKNFQAKLHETADLLRKKITDCDNELKKY